MKNLSFIILALFVVGIFAACNDDEPDILLTCQQQAIISATDYQTATSDPINIDSLSIEENCLSITFRAGGCDGSTWQVRLVDSGSIAESLPPQRNLKLLLENQEVCLAYITRTITFDIYELEADGEASVLLNIEDSNSESKQILYEY
ncbi:MAG: hypothetical protein ACPG5B_02685 [Chitinophagales bacterium]